MKTGVVPYSLSPSAAAHAGGFWGRLRASARHGATFDGAMRQKEHLGGAAVAAAYPWHRRAPRGEGGCGHLCRCCCLTPAHRKPPGPARLRAHTGSPLPPLPISRFDRVIDVAGGNGQLLARLLARCPALAGTLVDQPEQIERGKKVGA